jgi:ParB family chromosome partitioning protein
MSNKRGVWIARRGQAGAGAAIERVLDLQPPPGEHVQSIADEQIEDSPYQARRDFSVESVDELVQGMREVGFQGVLVARHHGDDGKRAHGLYQLAYGHRRRMAWRQVCGERGEPCRLPVVVREITDAQLLTIGAQENLQRHDLDPIEEAQIVAWHERMFFEKNQAEIGSMLGKSSDWISVRSRIHKLPDTLKEYLRQRPRAIRQMLELGVLYMQQPERAVALAERVVHDHLTIETMRALVNEQTASDQSAYTREIQNNRRPGAISVQDITNLASTNGNTKPNDAAQQPLQTTNSPVVHTLLKDETIVSATPLREDPVNTTDLRAAAATLASLAARSDDLSGDPVMYAQVELAEQSLTVIRRAFTRRTLPSTVLSRSQSYRLLNMEFSDLVAMLCQHHVAFALLRPVHGSGRAIYLLFGRPPMSVKGAGSAHPGYALCIATPGGGSGIAPTSASDGCAARCWHIRFIAPGATCYRYHDHILPIDTIRCI